MDILDIDPTFGNSTISMPVNWFHGVNWTHLKYILLTLGIVAYVFMVFRLQRKQEDRKFKQMVQHLEQQQDSDSLDLELASS